MKQRLTTDCTMPDDAHETKVSKDGRLHFLKSNWLQMRVGGSSDPTRVRVRSLELVVCGVRLLVPHRELRPSTGPSALLCSRRQ